MKSTELLIDEGSIAHALEAVAPTHVAVAYVGRDWDKYISKKHLEEIIVSPTLGSNPHAIDKLRSKECLGADQVHFLDALHAKVYLGKDMAVLGSSNLTRNGLRGPKGLIETAVLLRDTDQINLLRAWFEEQRQRAKDAYPNDAKKVEKLCELHVLFRRNPDLRVATKEDAPSGPGKALANFNLNSCSGIHIAGWSIEVALNKERVHQEFPDSRACSDISKYFEDFMAFKDGDSVKRGDWILEWRAHKNSFRPLGIKHISWLFVDRVTNATENPDYPLLAVQEWVVKPSAVPFELTDKIKETIRELLMEPEFAVFREEERVEATDPFVKGFIQALKARLR